MADHQALSRTDRVRSILEAAGPDTIEPMTAPQPAPGTAGAARVPDHALRAGLVAGAAYTLVGWRALLVPSLILFVAPAFGQADAGMGAYYLATALAYGLGALSGAALSAGSEPAWPSRRRQR